MSFTKASKFGHSLLEQKSVAIALLIKIDGSGSYAAPDLRSIHWFGAARSIGSVSKLLSETALSVEANLHKFSSRLRLSKDDKFPAAL
ncbi:hypothetical protein N9P54_01755, partial [Planktomarina sp.]|nr:hypothetical protein [Planktomarina sp.]